MRDADVEVHHVEPGRPLVPGPGSSAVGRARRHPVRPRRDPTRGREPRPPTGRVRRGRHGLTGLAGSDPPTAAAAASPGRGACSWSSAAASSPGSRLAAPRSPFRRSACSRPSSGSHRARQPGSRSPGSPRWPPQLSWPAARWGPTVAGYTFALAAALLLGLNRRQYLARTEQAHQLLAESQRARHEQARAAALDERARIAREIHDLLAHSLGALAVQLDVTEALLADGADPALVQTRLHRARGLAVDGLTEARRAVAALRGDTPPLPQLLDGLLQQYRADGGVARRLQVSGAERSLPPDASLAALRTAQEAISNARKHAPGAASAWTWPIPTTPPS